MSSSSSSASYLDEQAALHPELASVWQELSQLHKSKLWHQLTLKLTELTRLPYFQQPPHFLSLHSAFISPSASKLNPLSYATFAVLAASQQPDPQAALSFLSGVSAQVKGDEQASLLLMMEATRYRLKEGDIEEGKKRLDEGKRMLDSYAGVMAAELYSIYYRTACELALAQQDHNEYYTNALLFLTYTDTARMTEAERVDWALQLSLAALVGSRIYNFGELLQHSVLTSLANTHHAWLPTFLSTFNTGDLAHFHSLLVDAATAQPLLSLHAPFLQQKIRVMCLIDLVFRRPARERVFSFEEVASACEVERKEVEWLVMKGLALKVIKGKIDEVKGEVKIGWVQARVLDMQQIGVLRERLGEWRSMVKAGESYVERHAKDIITSTPA